MKIKPFLLVAIACNAVFFSSCESAQATKQSEWRSLPNIPESTARYDDVFFLNKNLGWAADGVGGKVFKTTDGGLQWTEQLDLNGEYFRNIEFLNENTGFLGMLSNNFYKTIDGGQTWQTVTNIPGPIEAICGLDTVGENTVYGCGAYFSPAYIIKSTDKGNTWQYIDMSQYAESLVEILFLNENVGFASGGSATGGVILKTTNGGSTWTPIYTSGIAGEWVWKLQILHSDKEVMFGSVESAAPLTGKLIKSSNGGASWISHEVPDTDIQAVGFITPNHGWMGGHHTGFLETFDGGATWTDTQLGGNLNRIQIFNGNLAYCSGSGIYKFSADEIPADNRPYSDAKRKDLPVTMGSTVLGNNLAFSVKYDGPNHIILRLFDSNGKLVTVFKRERITASETKDYSFPFPYEEGVYYLNLHDDTGGQSEMIVKK